MAASENEYRGALQAYVKLTRAENAVERRVMVHEPLPAGMTVSQFGVLEALLHKGPLTHHEVAEKILKTRGNITSVVDHLERAGLVARRRCDVDRRRVFLELTDEGQRAAQAAFERMREAIVSAMSVLEPDELVELGRLCRKLGRGDTE
ncbi:MAG TPA: MarR family winged helix-turn-helix transcriptional regulator [Spirochaetia bacterium]|nr:MarR family winged helix-turn-helix transcriptional regulator [Spirochaetia bacterium]